MGSVEGGGAAPGPDPKVRGARRETQPMERTRCSGGTGREHLAGEPLTDAASDSLNASRFTRSGGRDAETLGWHLHHYQFV